MPDLNALIDPWIEVLSKIIEVAGVLVIMGGILWATFAGLKRQVQDRYRQYRQHVGRSLLLGLELLVAADVIRTVALELTLQSLGTLALLVFIRTFLAWALEVEIDGRWPWQTGAQEGKQDEDSHQ